MTNSNKDYTFLKIFVSLISVVGGLFAANYYGFNKGAETYKGALKQAELILKTTQEELKKKSDEFDKLKIDYVLMKKEEEKVAPEEQLTPKEQKDIPKGQPIPKGQGDTLKPTVQEIKEIAKIERGSSEIFHDGIYVGCGNISSYDADITVSFIEQGKSEIKRQDMTAGESIDISYKNKNYKVVLRKITSWVSIVVSVVEVKN